MAEAVIDIAGLLRQAIDHHRAGRLGHAEAACRQVLRSDANQPTALNLLGTLARHAGRLDMAIELFRRAVAVVPDFADANYNLANALREKGDLAGALEAYGLAIEQRPEMPGAHNNLGVTLLASGDVAQAEEAFRRAVELKPDYADALNNLGNALQKQDRMAEAVDAYQQAIRLQPEFGGALANLGGALIKLGRTSEALAPLDRLLAREKQNIRAVAYKAIALRELGRDAEADVLEDTQRLVGMARPAVPPGFVDIAAFNRQLIAEIRAHPTLTKDWDPYQRAARLGAVAVDLLSHRSPAIAALETMVRNAIDAFAAGLPDDPAHPFLCHKPRKYSLIMWANILREEGHQAAHIHNLGWLSGVYYPWIPPTVRADDPAHAGWIEFGRPGYDLPCRYQPRTRTIMPENGMILMFPSYFWHHTIPFHGAPERISVAFDVHPEETSPSAQPSRPKVEIVNSTTAREAEAIVRRVEGPVLQIGSRADVVDRQENRWRALVKGHAFTGMDIEPGENVDVVGDICGDFATVSAALGDQRFGFIVCSHVLEHTRKPWIAAANITGLLRPGGHCFVAVPWVQAYHGFPRDYWRFSFHGLVELFPGIEMLDMYYSASGTGFDTAYKILVDGKVDLARSPFDLEASLFQVLLDHEHNRNFIAEAGRGGEQKLLLARGYMPVTLVNVLGRRSRSA
ncbi:MAG: tetratricopeptide repeat protein [Alphaproteobacteria bacterium]|nr:tetratricopeptide repeat protein [Alphaproteobacteria bacterium]